jgi:hypothetical protein
MEEPKPDFAVEVESLEEEPNDTMPKIIPRNVPLVAKPVPLVAKPVSLVTKPVPLMAKPVENSATMPAVKPVETPVESSSVEDSLDQKPTANQLAETIEIENPKSIFPHIEPYPETSPKQHHFQLKHKVDRTQLINVWSQNDITAELNDSGKNNVDVTLTRQDQIIGKIQFLHFDRRDRSNRAKYYVKIYLYQFDDSSMFEKAKQIMREFFHQIGSRPRHRSPQARQSPQVHRSPRTSRTRRIHRKKAHSTRKYRKPVRK